MAVTAGTRFGPYEIVTFLGAGGMGEVYQARDERLTRMVALKILPPELVADTERKRRFIQEAQLASSLQHPNIVTIFDIGSAEGGEYLAMELVRGRTLDSVIPQKGLRLPEALKLGIQIIDALAAAHGAGIVHRDLKPGNIMVTEQGQIKILDFGLATLTEAETMPAADETRAQAKALETGAGTILGTVAYMSPEQAEGRKVDARSDIFSFGAILYEMLSGKRAFRADSTPGTLAAVINLVPQPLVKVVEDIPQAVDRLVSRCLRKDLTRRAQHASDIKLALEELQEDSDAGSLHGGTAVIPAPKRRRLGAIAGIAAVILALAIAGAAMFWWPRTPPARSSFAPVPLTSLPGSESQPSFSPDGSQVAFAWAREGAQVVDVYVQLIGGNATPLRLTDDGATHLFPAWSPDGKSIAFWHLPVGTGTQSPNANGTLNLASPLGGAERQVLEWHGSPRRIVWSPDGRWLAMSPVGIRSNRNQGITLVSPTSGEKIEWAAIDKAYAASTDPAFSRDGRRIAYIVQKDDFSADVYLAPVGSDGKPSGPPTILAYGGKEARSVLWTPDGRNLLVIDGAPSSNGGVIRVSIDGSHPSEKLGGLDHPSAFALSASGTQLVFARGGLDADIWRVDLQNPAASGRVAASTLHDEAADYSSQGTRIAFSSNRSGPREIWVADITGDHALALTTFGGPVTGSARWSPDDRLIAFDGRPEGNAEVFVVPAGGGAIRQITKSPGDDGRPFWSHDGRWIYFSSDRSGATEIWRVSVDGGDPMQITKGGGVWGASSRDGQWIYYLSSAGFSPIRRVHPDGSGDAQFVDTRAGAIAVTDHALWFAAAPRAGESCCLLRSVRFADNKIIDVAKIDFLPSPVGMSVSLDERYALVTRPDQSGNDLFLVNDFR